MVNHYFRVQIILYTQKNFCHAHLLQSQRIGNNAPESESRAGLPRMATGKAFRRILREEEAKRITANSRPKTDMMGLCSPHKSNRPAGKY